MDIRRPDFRFDTADVLIRRIVQSNQPIQGASGWCVPVGLSQSTTSIQVQQQRERNQQEGSYHQQKLQIAKAPNFFLLMLRINRFLYKMVNARSRKIRINLALTTPSLSMLLLFSSSFLSCSLTVNSYSNLCCFCCCDWSLALRKPLHTFFHSSLSGCRTSKLAFATST